MSRYQEKPANSRLKTTADSSSSQTVWLWNSLHRMLDTGQWVRTGQDNRRKSTDGSKQRAHIWLRESPQQILTDGGYGNRMLLVWIVWSCISGPHSFLTAVIRSRGHAHQTKEIRAVRCCCSYTGPRTMILDQSVMCKHCCRAHLSSVSGVGWENCVGFMLTPVN